MTRQEQIKEAARQRADQYDHPSKWSDTYYGFIDGAKWADQHPQWISVEEELPPRQSALSHCSSNVMAGFFGDAGNYVCGAFYDHKEKKWFDSDDDKPLDADGEYRVTHWMPIVPPRKEDKK